MKTYHVDVQDGDREYVNNVIKEIDSLIGMSLEVFGKEKHLLLSPIMRDLVYKKAQEIDRLMEPFRYKHVFIDNPGEKLKPGFPKYDYLTT